MEKKLKAITAKSKTEFMESLSHEVKTPLNGILGLLYLMERDINAKGEIDRESLKHYLSKARETANGLLSHVDDMLCEAMDEEREVLERANPHIIRTAQVAKRILIAEDNELNAELLRDILEGEGFKVDLAPNGKEAIDRFKSSGVGEYDLILMDLQMPVMDGCTATKEIRKLDRNDAKTVLIFACTANTFKEDRERAKESGMNDFISKPIDVDELLMKLVS